jgi:uncharacterized protein YhdP
MANAVVQVTHPTERVDGSPASLADIQSWRLLMKAKAATNYSPLGGARLPSDTTANVQNLATGEYDFRCIWTDKDGQDSEPAETTYVVGPPAKLKPGAISVEPA